MSDNNQQNWLTAADAAQVLKVTPRQVHRYGEMNQLETRRAGRRVLFSAASVARLADELAVEYRPAPPPSRDIAPMVDALEQLRKRDDTFIEGQQRIEQRLQRIEERRTPRWIVILAIVAVLLILASFIILLVIATRLP